MAAAGAGEGAGGLTVLTVAVTDVVGPVPHTGLVATPATQAAAGAELKGWVTVAVAGGAAAAAAAAVVVVVVVGGVTTEGAGGTVFITELTPDWFDITILD